METFGIEENRPKSKKHLNYDELDLKSMRIVNRILTHLKSKNIAFDDAFKDIQVI